MLNNMQNTLEHAAHYHVSHAVSVQSVEMVKLMLVMWCAAAGSSIQASPSPGRQRPIHPSSPQGASWGSRHAQHIGNRPGSQTTGKKEKAPKKAQELQVGYVVLVAGETPHALLARKL